MIRHDKLYPVLALGALALTASPALATDQRSKGGKDCDIISHETLRNALRDSVAAANGPSNGGFDLHMWASVVNRDGIVCRVAFSGDDRGDQWPGSRVISAQKANTANAFSLPDLALSTANLWTAVQPGGSTFVFGDDEVDPPEAPIPGGSLFGLQHSNPVDPSVAYQGPASRFGQPNDPMVGQRLGGVNVFGGGLALYDDGGTLLGALGVSGDTSCADHNVAWRVRHTLGLDNVPGGVGTPADNIIFDVVDTGNGNAVSPSGFGHPECLPGDADFNENVVTACPIGEGPSDDCVEP